MVDDLLSIIDSCYIGKILQLYFSERALMSSRIFVEVEYLLALSETKGVGCRRFSDYEATLLRQLPKMSVEDFGIIKAIETKGYTATVKEKAVSFPKTEHDVKAVEYFMQAKLVGTSLEDCFNWIHFGLTSEDINNLAISRNIKRFLDEIYLTALDDSYSHETALPSFRNAHAKLNQLRNKLADFKFSAKLMGATGTLAAHRFALPDVDWLGFSRNFVESFGFKFNQYVTQVEPKDNYAELFQLVTLVNQLHIQPQIYEPEAKKVNMIINMVNCCLQKSNALFQAFADKLPVSRLQRDLSDSTVQRNIGLAFGYSLLALKVLHGEETIDILETKSRIQSSQSMGKTCDNDIINCDAISPLVGRYYKDVKELDNYTDMTAAIKTVYLSAVSAVINHLDAKAHEYAAVAMLARTHGQPATPTTVGKEYRIFAERLSIQVKELERTIEIDSVLKSSNVAYTIARINTIIKDLAVDFWLYIKDEWLVQKNTDTIGSSTMPHKINPINFENAEGNVYIANALLYRLALDEAINYGVHGLKEAVGYSLLVAKSLLKGLEKTAVNVQKIRDELLQHPTILAEAYQTELRKPEYAIAESYLLLKGLTQQEQGTGKSLTLEQLHAFVDTLPISEDGKNKLKSLRPDIYLGYAEKIARKTI